MRRLWLICVILALLGSPALAQDRDEQPIEDTVTLRLAAEDWVETESARVEAIVEAAFEANEAGSLRARIGSVLDGLAAGADWRIIHFGQSRDSTGLDRWRVTASARLSETALDGIRDRAESASKPGLRIAIVNVDFTPTLAEREAALAKLRAAIYRDALAERDRLSAAVAGRRFRIHAVDFTEGPVEPAFTRQVLETARADARNAAAEPVSGMAVAAKVRLDAIVTLAAVPPQP